MNAKELIKEGRSYTIRDSNNMSYLSIACLVCGESVELNELERCQLEYGHHISPKLCSKCKEAILHIRKELEEKDNNGSSI